MMMFPSFPTFPPHPLTLSPLGAELKIREASL